MKKQNSLRLKEKEMLHTIPCLGSGVDKFIKEKNSLQIMNELLKKDKKNGYHNSATLQKNSTSYIFRKFHFLRHKG